MDSEVYDKIHFNVKANDIRKFQGKYLSLINRKFIRNHEDCKPGEINGQRVETRLM